MYVQDILNLARLRLDDVVKDAKGNYLWSDDELLIYYNETEGDFARRTRCLYDASTAAVCSYDIFPGVQSISIDRRIVEINAAYLSGIGRELFRTSAKSFGYYTWRSVQGLPSCYIPNYEPHSIRFFPYYPTTYQGTVYIITGVSDISFSSSGTISRATGGLLTMFPSGESILISGTTSNNGKIVSAGGTETVLNVTGTVVTEANTSAVLTKKVETLKLEVARLPLVQVAIADTTTKEPEIDSDYHTKLVDGILSLAYLKRDSETYNLQESAKYKERWDAIVEEAKTDQIILTESDEAFLPSYGSI